MTNLLDGINPNADKRRSPPATGAPSQPLRRWSESRSVARLQTVKYGKRAACRPRRRRQGDLCQEGRQAVDAVILEFEQLGDIPGGMTP